MLDTTAGNSGAHARGKTRASKPSAKSPPPSPKKPRKPSPAKLEAEARKAAGLPPATPYAVKPKTSLAPFAPVVRKPIPHSNTKTTKYVKTSEGEGLHVFLVDYRARTMRPVRLEGLVVREDLELRRASKRVCSLARQTVLATTEGQHRFVVQAALDEMRWAAAQAAGQGPTAEGEEPTAGKAA